MTRRCFLHIGTHKTGTTSIQRMLSGSALLADAGFYYPSWGQPSDSIPGHHNIAWQLMGNPHFQPEHGSVDDLITEVRQRPEDIILSSEDFSGVVTAHPHRFAEFVGRLKAADFEVIILSVFRNHLEWLPRVYLTYVQAGWDLSWRDSLAMNVPPDSLAFEILRGVGAEPSQCKSLFLNYLDLLRNADRIGKVIVREYKATSACRDFLGVLNLTLAGIGASDEIRANASIPLREYLLTFARNKLRRDLTAAEKEALAETVPADQTRIQLSPDESRKMLSQFEETNRVLREDYGIPEPTIAEPLSGSERYVDELFQ